MISLKVVRTDLDLVWYFGLKQTKSYFFGAYKIQITHRLVRAAFAQLHSNAYLLFIDQQV
jgi:hypothetical protein